MPEPLSATLETILPNLDPELLRLGDDEDDFDDEDDDFDDDDFEDDDFDEDEDDED